MIGFSYSIDAGVPQLDITGPETPVEIVVSQDKKVIWVNTEGVCVLRICRIPELIMEER